MAAATPIPPAFIGAIEALYPVGYKLTFASKRDLGRDYVVPPLEGLWWAEDMDPFTAARDKVRWDWRRLLMVPDWIDRTPFATAFEQAGAKNRPTRLNNARLERLSEGRSVQTVHVSSFDDEANVLKQMHAEFIPGQGVAPGRQPPRCRRW